MMHANLVQLLRHGATRGGRRFRGSTDDPLTPLGWAQMQAAVKRPGPWNAIVSSPLRRCAGFAHHLAASLQLPLRMEPRLREIHFGCWEGRTVDEIARDEPQALHRFWREVGGWMPPGAEPFTDFRQRVLAAWNELLERSPESVLVITHAGPIRIILCRAYHQPTRRFFERSVPLASVHTLLPVGRATPTP